VRSIEGTRWPRPPRRTPLYRHARGDQTSWKAEWKDWRVGLEDISALSLEERKPFFHAAYQTFESVRDNTFSLCLRLMDKQLWEAGTDFFGITSLRPDGALLEPST